MESRVQPRGHMHCEDSPDRRFQDGSGPVQGAHCATNLRSGCQVRSPIHFSGTFGNQISHSPCTAQSTVHRHVTRVQISTREPTSNTRS